jgi:hypothetical protein
MPLAAQGNLYLFGDNPGVSPLQGFVVPRLTVHPPWEPKVPPSDPELAIVRV